MDFIYQFSTLLSPQRYRRLTFAEPLLEKPTDSKTSSSASSLSEESYISPQSKRSNDGRRLVWALALLCFVFLTTTIALSVAYLLKVPSDKACGIQTSVWSPANEAIEYEELDFENGFGHQTIYRGPPTPALEQAWEKLWLYGGIRIPSSYLPQLNRTAPLPANQTLKPVHDAQAGYHALLEVFHQLHCLNLIRQYTWRAYYASHTHILRPPADMRDSPVGARMHVDHCIEALRLSLMCHADTTPYMILLDPAAPGGMRADFSPHHKCRRFESVVEWARENELARPPPGRWEPEEGA